MKKYRLPKSIKFPRKLKKEFHKFSRVISNPFCNMPVVMVGENGMSCTTTLISGYKVEGKTNKYTRKLIRLLIKEEKMILEKHITEEFARSGDWDLIGSEQSINVNKP